MAASALTAGQVLERALLTKWALILYVCWEAAVQGRLTELGSLQNPGADTLQLRCHVPEEESQLFRLQGHGSLHEKEFAAAIQDLGALLSHVQEANLVLESAEMTKVQDLLQEVASKLAPATG